ncbi:RHS repeat-associated core domain-containing protein, partial [Actinokineospora sp.]|uniref:RHS repeat-associated core domain-containing protein n=1 Tax=Actinokineospora sp. TaxID=1872133 RepID=UPI003D6C254C
DELDRLVRRRDAGTGGWSELGYDRVGNLVRETDPRLNQTSYSYDARDRRRTRTVHLDRVSALGAATTRYGYDAVGNLTAEEPPNGNSLVHRYDELDRLLETRDELGLVLAASYDARGNRLRTTDANGRLTTNEYDALDRLVRQELPESRTVAHDYDVAGNRIATTDPGGHRSRFAYDSLDRLVTTTDPAPFAFTTRLSYDLAGNKVAETDRRGHPTDFAYDALHRLVRVTDPPLSREGDVRRTMSYRYDAVGNRVEEVDRRGIASELRYDAENRLLERRRDGVSVQRFEYDLVGNKKLEYDAIPSHPPTGYEYDERNLLVATHRPLGATVGYERDLMGEVTVETDPEGRTTRRGYDARRRLVAETNGAGETTRYEVDGEGNRTAMVRPKGADAAGSFRWEYEYDGAARLRFVRDPLANATEYRYDADGNRTLQLDAAGKSTRLEYDELHRQTKLVYAGGAEERYEHDEAGNRTVVQTPNGAAIASEYDERNREVVRQVPVVAGAAEVSRIATAYDGNDNVVRVEESFSGPTGTRTESRAYDRFDRLQTATDRFGKVTTYSYDNNGNRTSLKDADGLVTRYELDALDRLDTVTSAAGVTDYESFRDGRLASVTYPGTGQAGQSGTAGAQHAYDASGRLATLRNTFAGASVSSYEYRYDRNGNRVEQVEVNGAAAETTTYEYDDADRLTGVDYPDQAVDYTYDAVGNRLTEKVTTATAQTHDKTYTYNDRHQLTTLVDRLDAAANTTYAYDANGNQTSRTSGGLETRFAFDALDRVVSVERELSAGSGFELLGRYQYDWQGLRVEKRTGSGVVRYTYDDQSVLLQHGVDGVTIAKYDYGPDRLLSLNHKTEGRSFYLFDGLGSPVTLMAADGAVRERSKYDAWGNLRSQTGDSWNPFAFTGHELDEETGLYYAKARFYDPEVGRFLSEDPLDGEAKTPPSLHRYLYAFDQPTLYVDPTGEATVEVAGRQAWVPDVAVEWGLEAAGWAVGQVEAAQE